MEFYSGFPFCSPIVMYLFQGLECNPRHWLCLDNVISVLYALGNYEGNPSFLDAS